MSEQYDPYERTAEAVQEPPATLRDALFKIGPGLVLAGSIVGTGELIATTQVGAQAGFVLLWLVLLSCVIKVFVQIELGRFAISSGETTLTSIKRLPRVGNPMIWWWLIMIIVTQTQIGAMIGAVGASLSRVFDAKVYLLDVDAFADPDTNLTTKPTVIPDFEPWQDKALKVVFNADGHLGAPASAADWTGYTHIRFDAVNPGDKKVKLNLTLRSVDPAQMSGPSRQIVAPFELAPGGNSVKLLVASFKNADGSPARLDNIESWRLSEADGGEATVYFSDIWATTPAISALTFAILITLATMALLVTGSYRIVERVTVSLVVLFTFMTVTCVVLLPYTENSFSWGNLAEGFTFRIPESAVMAAFAMIGITGVGATELIMYPYWCIEKGYARNVGPNEENDSWLHRAKGWLRVMYLDAWVSLVVYTMATIAFYFLGAAVLYEYTAGAGLPDTADKLLDALGAMYAPVIGEEASNWFIVIGAFATLYSTLFAAVAAHSRTLTDFLRINNMVTLRDHADRLWWIRVFALILPVTGLVLYVFMKNPVLMVAIGGIMQAVTLPMIAGAAVYLRYRRTDRRLLPGNLWDVMLWLSALVLFVVAGYGIWHQFTKADIERVQGKWVLASAESEGAPLTSAEIRDYKLTITLNRFRITDPTGELSGGTFRLITSTTPTGIDVERTIGPDQGKLLGIYEIVDGTFKVCLAPPGAPRPTEFSAPPGSGRILRVWKKP